MPNLSLSLHQPDDGDGLARFRARAENGAFALSVLFWGYVGQLAELAATLQGFPTSGQSNVEFVLGSPRTGTRKLNFSCIDGWGHIGLWVTGESEFPFFTEDKHQRAELALRVEAGAIDVFHAELLALATGTSEIAVLQAMEP